ncbi:MAG: hypothetical protein ACW99U_20190 [Candidatus Thorarchaeota archaeon]|jgi:hypothetical protein
MGTTFNHGDKPKNKITISKSSAVPRKIDPDTGTTDRSFAQPNPVNPPEKVTPRVHASKKDEEEAIERNVIEGRDEDTID